MIRLTQRQNVHRSEAHKGGARQTERRTNKNDFSATKGQKIKVSLLHDKITILKHEKTSSC